MDEINMGVGKSKNPVDMKKKAKKQNGEVENLDLDHNKGEAGNGRGTAHTDIN